VGRGVEVVGWKKNKNKKKMGRGYKIGAKDFGLKTKGLAVRACSGGGGGGVWGW
jgi:hypothetical protein